MSGWRVAEAFLVGVSTFVISFIVTMAGTIGWVVWSSRDGNTAQGDMGAFFFAVMVAPLFAVSCTVLSLWLTRKKYPKEEVD